MKTQMDDDVVAVSTTNGKRTMWRWEYESYLNGADKVRILDEDDDNPHKILATCHIVGLWPQKPSVVRAFRDRYHRQVMGWLSERSKLITT